MGKLKQIARFHGSAELSCLAVTNTQVKESAPRVRGDGPVPMGYQLWPVTCSPRPWGWPRYCWVHWREFELPYALAGRVDALRTQMA